MRVKSCRGSPEYWMKSPCGNKIISNINSNNHDDYRAPEHVERGGAFTCRMVFANSDTDGWKCRASCREHQTLGYTQQLVNTSSGYWNFVFIRTDFFTFCSSHKVERSAPQNNGFLCSGS